MVPIIALLSRGGEATSVSIFVSKEDDGDLVIGRNFGTSGKDSIVFMGGPNGLGSRCLSNSGSKSKKPWATLFGVKPNPNSSPIVDLLELDKGKFSIFVLDSIIDHYVSLMSISLVGKFMGPCQNIEVV